MIRSVKCTNGFIDFLRLLLRAESGIAITRHTRGRTRRIRKEDAPALLLWVARALNAGEHPKFGLWSTLDVTQTAAYAASGLGVVHQSPCSRYGGVGACAGSALPLPRGRLMEAP